jgi:putative hemolysin
MARVARASRPLAWFLEASTHLVMRAFGKAESAHNGPTREEVSVLIREGVITGVLDEDESDMVEGVLDLAELRAEEVMQPKPKVVFFDAGETVESVRPRVLEAVLDVFPIVQDNRDQVLGTVSLREMFAATDIHAPLSSLVRPPVFVPENQPALSLLDTLHSAPHHAALVIDEFGTVRGLVRLLDLLEEVVGDISRRTPGPAQPSLRQTEPGAWLADGGADIDSVTDAIPGLEALVEAEDDPFQTLGGFIVHRMNRLPQEGETFSEGGFRFEIVDMDQHRIDKVLIRVVPAEPEASADGRRPANEE